MKQASAILNSVSLIRGRIEWNAKFVFVCIQTTMVFVLQQERIRANYVHCHHNFFAQAGQRIIMIAGVPLSTTNMLRIAYIGRDGGAG